MSVYFLHMFQSFNFVWWPQGKAKKPGCQSTFYMFQSINLCDGHRAKPKRPRMSISLLFTCFDPLIPSHGDWAKPRKNPGFQPIAFTCCDAKTPSDGDWAKPKKARMSVYSVHMFRCVHPILWQLGKAGKTQDASLLFRCSMRKLCLMGTGQSQKNSGCQPIVFTCFDAYM